MQSQIAATDELITELQTMMKKMNDEVPEKTRKMLDEVQRLDREAVRIGESCNQQQVSYMTHSAKLTAEQKVQAFQKLQKYMNDVVELSDKKLALINDSKTMLQEFHEQFHGYESRFIENVKSPSKTRSPVKDEDEEEEEDDDDDDEEPDDEPKSRKRKGGAKKKKEKLYCWCKLTKQDEMVACDNPQCKLEWFHFQCIKMTSAPSGDWYCSTECQKQALANKKKSNAGRKRKRN